MAASDVRALTDRPGVYVLGLRLSRRAVVDVGRLGRCDFPPGWYAYVGSARGPGGLAARLTRHLRFPKPLHWHVDYLRAAAQPVAVWYTTTDRPRECEWARVIAALPGATIPVARFGASDCRCVAHLIRFPAPLEHATLAHALGEAVLWERWDV